MGGWFVRKRNTLHRCYISEVGIFWRDEMACYKCKPSKTSNFHYIDYDNPTEPPLESHPIDATYISDGRVWVWRKYRPHHLRPRADENHVNSDVFVEHPNSRLNLVSDASVHVKDRKVAGAWHLLGKDVKRRCMVRTLEH
jgi:hypothetical protein